MQNFYTDLALEIAENLQSGDNKELEGLQMDMQQEGNTKITTVSITNDTGADAMGKPIGKYITIESPKIKANDIDAHEQIMGVLVNKLADLRDGLKIPPNGTILVVGLGNRNVAPDALGPMVVSKLLVTRHILDNLPNDIAGTLRPLAAIAPGVMGMTGIETAEAVKGLVMHVKPALVIAIDALAARSIVRINQTIQLTDTGISPGAGVGNRRMALNIDTLGVPVIAIGVPTVVDAGTFSADVLDLFLSEMAQDVPEALQDGAHFFEMLNELEEMDKSTIIRNTISPHIGDMFVTPKEIGEVVRWLSNIIANGINISMHKGVTKTDINRFMY